MTNAEPMTGAEFPPRSLAGPASRDALASDETAVVDVATDSDSRTPGSWLPEEG
jgi:hypothetical protein